MFESMIIILTAFYAVPHPSFASVRFSAEADTGLMLSIIHKSLAFFSESARAEADIYDFLGPDASEKIEVEDKDVLIVLAERQGSIVGSQVYEVDLSAVHQGYLLIPRGGYNILCEQTDVTCKDEARQEVLYVSID